MDDYCGLTKGDARLVCVEKGKVSINRPGPFIDMDLHENLAAYRELCTVRDTGELACDGFAGPLPAGEFKQVALGFFNPCALTRDGRVECWFPPEVGGSPAPAHTLDVNVEGDGCALDVDGNINCWGNQRAPGPTVRFRQISVSSNQVCALDSEDRAHCFESRRHTL